MSENHVVDARGLACPMPVVKTKKAIDAAAQGTVVTALVDNETARDNVTRMAESAGCSVKIEGVAPDFRLLITVGAKAANASRTAACCTPGSGSPTMVVYVNKDVMGHGDETLGRILIKAFVQTLKDVNPRPGKIVFINSGVHLACEGSPVLPALKELSDSGVKIVSCGTCLDFYKEMDKVRVGIVSNMYEIVTMLANADRVVAP